MNKWVSSDVEKVLSNIPGISIESKTDGEHYTTDGFCLKVDGTENNLWVRGFIVGVNPIAAPDNVDVEHVEVTTGYSDGNMPNDPVLILAHAYVRAALTYMGFHTVNSLERFF